MSLISHSVLSLYYDLNYFVINLSSMLSKSGALLNGSIKLNKYNPREPVCLIIVYIIILVV